MWPTTGVILIWIIACRDPPSDARGQPLLLSRGFSHEGDSMAYSMRMKNNVLLFCKNLPFHIKPNLIGLISRKHSRAGAGRTGVAGSALFWDRGGRAHRAIDADPRASGYPRVRGRVAAGPGPPVDSPRAQCGATRRFAAFPRLEFQNGP